MIHDRMPEYVAGVLSVLNENGFEAFCVGGCVRDGILGKKIHDWDITTSAKPDEIVKLFQKTVLTGAKYGTVTVLCGKNPVEVTTYRTDGKYTDERHPENVEFTSKLENDLKRRDFTINAMARGFDGKTVDIFGGMDDIERKIIRCVGEAAERFSEDALRILRALRFSAVLGFEIAPETSMAMERCAPLCRSLSGERINSEITKILMSRSPERVTWLFKHGALPFDIDELAACKMKKLPKNADLRLFALSRISGGMEFLGRVRAKRELMKFSELAERYKCTTEAEARYMIHKEGGRTLRFLSAGEYICGNINLSQMRKFGKITVEKLCVTGHDMAALGYSGRKTGEKLDELTKIISENPDKNNRSELMKYVKKNNVSNYEITKHETAKLFLKYDMHEIITKLNIPNDADYLYITMFGVDYRVSRASGLVEGTRNKFANCYEADYNEAMTVYDILGYSKTGAHPSGEYINMRSLSSIQGSGKGLGDEIFGEEGTFFDGKETQLAKALEALGGVKYGKGDVSAKIPGFLGLDFLLQFWSGDDEFAPVLQVFTDKNILDYMHFETVWYAVSCLLRRVTEEFNGNM